MPPLLRLRVSATSLVVGCVLMLGSACTKHGAPEQAQAREATELEPEQERASAPELEPLASAASPTPRVEEPGVRRAIDRLRNHGVDATQIHVVANVEELIAATAPGRTIVLRPGEYPIPRQGLAALERTSQLILVGMEPRPKFVGPPEGARRGLTFDGVQQVVLCHVEVDLPGEAGEKPQAALRIGSSRGIKVIEVRIHAHGMSGIAIHASSTIEVQRSAFRNHVAEPAWVIDASDVSITDTLFQGEHDPERRETQRPFTISSADVTLTETRFHSFEGHPTDHLIEVDGREVPRDAFPETAAHPGSTVREGPSRVRMVGGSFWMNRSLHIANARSRLELTAVTMQDNSFPAMMGLDTNARACTCYRRRTADGYEQVSSCWRTVKACTAEAARVTENGHPLALAGSVTRECSSVYGNGAADAGWDTFFSSADQSLRPGVCTSDGPPMAPPTEPLGTPKPKTPWDSLDVWHGELRRSVATLAIPVKTKRFDRQIERMEAIRVPRGATKTPPELRRIDDPHAISMHRAFALGPYSVAELNTTPYDGSWWDIEFPGRSVDEPFIGVSRLSSPALRLRLPVGELPADLPKLVAQAERMLPPRWYAEYVLEPSPIERQILVVPGKFPGGANRLVMVAWRWAEDPEDTLTANTFTANADAEVVQVLTHAMSYAAEGFQFEFLADLDGDGYDEVGWWSYAWESEARHVTHLTEYVSESRTLFASGL